MQNSCRNHSVGLKYPLHTLKWGCIRLFSNMTITQLEQNAEEAITLEKGQGEVCITGCCPESTISLRPQKKAGNILSQELSSASSLCFLTIVLPNAPISKHAMCTNEQKHMQHTSVSISLGKAVTFISPVIFPSLVDQDFLFFGLRFCGQRNQVHCFVLFLKIVLSYNLGIVLIKKWPQQINIYTTLLRLYPRYLHTGVFVCLFAFSGKKKPKKQKTLKATFKGKKITKNTCSQKELADARSHANFVLVKVGSAQHRPALE